MTETVYPIKKAVGKTICLALGCLVLGAILINRAMTDHRGLIIDGIIPISPEVATALSWVLGVAATASAPLLIFRAVVSATADKAVTLYEDRIKLPKGSYSTDSIEILFASISEMKIVKVILRRKTIRTLVITHPRGRTLLEENSLDIPTAFDEICSRIGAHS